MATEAPSVGILQPTSRSSYTGSIRIAITAAYFASFFSIGIVLASLGPILPALANRLHTSIDAVGILFVARSSGYLVGSVIGGVIFDRMQRTHLPLLFGNLLCAVGCAVIPSLSSIGSLSLAIVTQGFCMGLLDTGGNVLLIWLHGSGRVEPYMQTMHFFFALGAVLSPMIIELTVQLSGRDDGFDIAFYGMATLLVLASAPLISTRGPHPPQEQTSSSSSSSATSSSADARLSGGGSGGGRASQQRRLLCGLQSLEAWLVVSSSACLCMYVGSEVGFGGFVFTFAVSHLRMATSAARALNSLYWGGLAFGRLSAIPAAARLRPETLLSVSLSGAAVAAAALLWVRTPGHAFLVPGDGSMPTGGPRQGGIGSYSSSNLRSSSSSSSAMRGGSSDGGGSGLAWVATGALGLFHAPIFPTTLTHAERYMRVSGRVASLFVVSAALGEAVLPALIALAYASSHASFPVILLVASLGQLAAYAAARVAARRLAVKAGRGAESGGVTRESEMGAATTSPGPSSL